MKLLDKGPRLSILLSSDVPAHLRGDAVRLRQILVNLIGNAFKFTESGEIAVTVSLLAVEGHHARLRFAVRDTGIGIPADRLDHIFTPFEQADMSTTRRFGGTGLGLSICRLLCEMMGGEIGVNSKAGEGSEFWFTALLGREGVAANAGEALAVGNHLDSDTRVLIVEDNPVNLLVLSNLVRKLGNVNIVSAHDGREALTRCQTQDFDIVFMDTRMPVLDGLEATVALRTDGNSCYIIGVSADAMAEDRNKALASGMNDYITKPVSISALNDAIARWSARP